MGSQNPRIWRLQGGELQLVCLGGFLRVSVSLWFNYITLT